MADHLKEKKKLTTLYHPIEQQEEIPVRDREDGMGAYLMMFAAWAVGLPLPIINLIAAIAYYITNRKKSRFVRFNALQSLYSQVPTTLLNFGLIFWSLRIMIFNNPNSETDLFGGFASVDDLYWGYLWTTVAANLIYVVFSIVAAVKARKGRFYYFIFFGKLAYHSVYRIRDVDEQGEKLTNKPPI